MKTAQAAGPAVPGAQPLAPTQTHALAIQSVVIDPNCIGIRVTAADTDRLARILVIIAMGQAFHAARIITQLKPSAPAINEDALRKNARASFTISGTTEAQREVSQYHRDGLIFESISWIAARQQTPKALLRDPHLSSTTQGLDGLMLQLNDAGSTLVRATIFEDKCSEHPRQKFRDEILPAFKLHHQNQRASALVATAAALLDRAGLADASTISATAQVLDKKHRAYRAGLATTTADDSVTRRQALFKDYDELKDIIADQRIGVVLVTSDDLRAWFEDLASRAVAYIDGLDNSANGVA